MKDPIDSRQLQIFVALARKGSLRAAAAELGLTNSAISHSIHALEVSLNAKLFHRPGKFLELTEKGQYLLKEAPVILGSMDRVRQQLAGDEALPHSSLRVAVGYSLISNLLPDVIAEWELCFPDSKLVVRAAERDTCLKWVSENLVDTAVVVDPPVDVGFSIEPLFADELMLVVAAESPLARMESVHLRSLHGKTFLTSRLQSHTTQLVLSEMRRHGFGFQDCIELGGIEGILEMVKLGTGVALLPGWIIDRRGEDKRVVALPLNSVRLIRRWAHVSHGKRDLTVLERTFLRLCRRFAANLQGGTTVIASAVVMCVLEFEDGSLAAAGEALLAVMGG